MQGLLRLPQDQSFKDLLSIIEARRDWQIHEIASIAMRVDKLDDPELADAVKDADHWRFMADMLPRLCSEEAEQWTFTTTPPTTTE